jgi:hypothetical protein
MPHASEPLEPDPVIEAVEERITKLMLHGEQAERDARRDTRGGE